MAIENANPTILTSLPTRSSASKDYHRRRTGPGHEFDHVLCARPAYMRAPFVRRRGGGAGRSSEAPSEASGSEVDEDGERERGAEAWWWDGEDGDGYESASEEVEEPIDEQEIYDLIANIADPEHPLSLGQLAVVNLSDIQITPSSSSSSSTKHTNPNTSLVYVTVLITPTITHCSHATIIGLAVRVRLERCLPPRFRVEVRVREGTHAQDDQVSKQLADKERVAAALENATLAGVLDKMLSGCDR